MPTIAKTIFYVLTIKHLPTDNFDERVVNTVQSIQTSKCVVVKEYGSGDNPHYNIILDFEDNQRADKYRNLFIREIYSNEKIGKNALVCRAVYDATQLIGGYLQKEEAYEVLLNKGYDLQDLKQKAVKIIATKGTNFHTKITPDNYLLSITQFIEVNEIDTPSSTDDVRKIIAQMIKSNYNFIKVLGKLGFITVSVLAHYGNDLLLEKYVDDKIRHDLQSI